MRKIHFIGFACFWAAQALLGLCARAQNWSTVTATNITDLNQQKLAAGQLCFLATDQNDNPISIGLGGGGQVLRRQYCAQVTAGAIGGFTVPNPANTAPAGIYYRVTAKDTSTGQEVLRYTQVTFAGTSFNFDNYAPTSQGSFSPPAGNAVSGNLSVNGNLSVTGTFTASNIPPSAVQQVFDSGVGLTQRTALNCTGGVKCSDNAGTSRTDVRLGTLTTVIFSPTLNFDASTATTFKLVLSGNVTSSTLTGAVAGEPLAFLICQDATGGRTFVPPANVLGWIAIPTPANACVMETFIYDGANAQADGDTAGQVLAQDGAAATPSISFENNTNTGFYRIAANRVGLALGGANNVDFQPAIDIFNSGSVKTNLYVADINNADAGLSRTAAATIAAGNGTVGNTSGTFEGRSVKLDGATSGSVTVVVPAAAGANTATLPANTGTVAETNLAQSWSGNQTGMALVTPSIGGTTITNVPTMLWSIDNPSGNVNFTSGAFSQFTPVSGITIKRVEVVIAGTSGAGCTTNPIVRITDGTTNLDVSIANGTSTFTSNFAQNYAAGAVLQMKTVAGAGCTTNPTGAFVNVQYIMQ